MSKDPKDWGCFAEGQTECFWDYTATNEIPMALALLIELL
jgi:hypothetical protein